MIIMFVFAGILASVVAVLRYEFARGLDPVLIFLVVSYPVLLGATVHYYLQQKKIRSVLNEEHYVRWYLQSFANLCLSESDSQLIRNELINTILRLIKPALVSVYELDTNNQYLEMIRQAGIKDLPDNAKESYRIGEGIPGWVMQNQNAVSVADISKEQSLQVDSWAKFLDFRSYAAVPIIVRGKSIGIIAMYSLEPNYFQDSSLLSAQMVAQMFGLSLAGQQATLLLDQFLDRRT